MIFSKLFFKSDLIKGRTCHKLFCSRDLLRTVPEDFVEIWFNSFYSIRSMKQIVQKYQHLAPIFLLILAGFLVYSNTLTAPFIFDDKNSILNNSATHSLRSIFATPRPFLNLTFALNYMLHGHQVLGYHLVNILIHISASLLLFGILRRTLSLPYFDGKFDHNEKWISFAVSLIWLVHPLQTGSVTYLTQRAESLMGCMYLLSFYAAIRGLTENSPKKWYGVSIAAAFFAMASKQVAVSIPIAIFLYDLIFISSEPEEMIQKRKFYYLGLLLIWLQIPASLLTAHAGETSTAGFFYDKISWIQYAKTQPEVILHYLKLTFWPVSLCLDYGWPIAKSAKEIAIPTLAIASFILVSIWLMKWKPALGFLSVWFFLTLAPTSSFMPLSDVAFEHRMYLPLIALLVLCVFLIHSVLVHFFKSQASRVGVVLCAIVIFCFGFLTIKRNQVYASSLSIWKDTLEKRPENARARNNYGVALFEKGEYERAIQYFKEAIALRSDYADPYVNMGAALTQTGNLKEAENYYYRALVVDPNVQDANYNLANMHMRAARYDQAEHHYQEELKRDPNHFHAHNNFANLLLAQNTDVTLAEAIKHYRKAIQINPRYIIARNNLGIALSRQQKFDEAAGVYKEAIRIFPDSADLYNSFGSVLAQQGKYDEAVKQFEKAVSLRPDFTDALANLDLARTQLKSRQVSPSSH